MVGAHCDDGVDAIGRVLLQSKQHLGQDLGLFAADLAGIAKELLELVQDDADVALAAELEVFLNLPEGVAAISEQAADMANAVEWKFSVFLRRQKRRDCAGQVPER